MSTLVPFAARASRFSFGIRRHLSTSQLPPIPPSGGLSTPKSSSSWPLVAAGIPLLIWARDSLFGFHRVQGSSMEPQLRHGDILLVRKAELGVLMDSMLGAIFGDDYWWKDSSNVSKQSSSSQSASYRQREMTERARLVGYEYANGVLDYAPVSRFYECPPLALSGHVVVFRDPEAGVFPTKLCIKRVIGVGGQYVRETESSLSLVPLPPYTLFVEGDNTDKSRDSRQYGPITKGLLVGIAEYVVWPPTRWQRIRRRTYVDDDTKELRAVWP